MNFTSDVKKELIVNGVHETARKAALAALLKTSGDVGLREGAPVFYFVSETESVAEFFLALFLEEFSVELTVSYASEDKLSGRAKLVVPCPLAHTERVAKALKLVKKTGELREGISPNLVAREEDKIAYLTAAFLGSGSCTLPSEEGGKTGYHLEWIFSDKKTAKDFCRLLAETELIGRIVERKESFVVYIKSKELISDFLSVVGANHGLQKFAKLVEKRDRANRDNRAKNCMAGNADKAAIAAVKQVRAIQTLEKEGKFEELPKELCDLARARIENPALSLQELANCLGISKSCLNHRMRKLTALCKKE